MSFRPTSKFGAATASFDPFGVPEPISFDFGANSIYEKPSFRSSPRISTIRPPISLPFDGTSLNGVIIGAALVAIIVGGYLLGKKQKWWK